MGNHPGNNLYYGGAEDQLTEKDSLLERLDYIASHYILTMDFNSLKKMYDKNYCNKLVVITSEIFDKYLTDLDVETVLKSKLNEKKDYTLFFNKSDIKNIEALDSEKKLDVCRKISTFYIKIAHLFAAIVMTINPEYVYTSQSGNLVKRNLYEKSKIPRGSNIKVVKTNLCSKRINALKKGSEKTHPICYFNVNDVKTLDEEPGIPELMHLYYDDNFDYKTGRFSEMSDLAREHFIKDLHLFYKEFTGEDSVPTTITKFSDIKFKNYESSGLNCKTDGDENTIIDQPFFVEYAKNLKQMISSAKEKQDQLLELINKVFVSVEKDDGKQFIRIQPHLTEQELQKIIENARTLIVELYLKCEEDFTHGIQLYEAIVESRIFQTTQMQIDNLKKKAELFIEDVNKK